MVSMKEKYWISYFVIIGIDYQLIPNDTDEYYQPP